MAINQPIIAAGTTKPRAHVTDAPVKVHQVGPGGQYVSSIEGVLTLVTVEPPTREGQVFFHLERVNNLNRTATMYVGVNISGTLTWVPADMGTRINGLTGRPFDSIYD